MCVSLHVRVHVLDWDCRIRVLRYMIEDLASIMRVVCLYNLCVDMLNMNLAENYGA